MKRVPSILLIVATLLLSINLNGQTLTHLWSGLTEKQAVQPKGNAPYQTPIRVPFKILPAKLIQDGEGEWIISEGWSMTDNTTFMERMLGKSSVDLSRHYNATVPGTVLTTLVEQGVYPDPYFGLNNLSIPDSLSRQSWWYEVTFKLPEEVKGERRYLLFNGINYRSEIYLNGKKVGGTTGAFKRELIDITDIVSESYNLKVHILPLNNPGIPHEQSMSEGQGLNGGITSADGPTFIASMGWDWIPGIRDRNIGIWQDVRLVVGGDVRIGDPLVVTKLPLPDTTRASVMVETMIYNDGRSPVEGELSATIKFNGVVVASELKLPYRLSAGEGKKLLFTPETFAALNLTSPHLWWPNGYGAPNLYQLELRTHNSVKTITFGIRELSYELMVDRSGKQERVAYTPVHRVSNEPLFDYINRVPYSKSNDLPTFASRDLSGVEFLDNNDPVGPYLVLRVNGVRIFCRGGNWGMDDAMKRVSRERLEPYFKLHKDLNFNIVRNWTGESTEEAFYTLADEYGMLVWNDFWITTDDTVEPADFDLFMTNVQDVVSRYRNHPSIALWCPRNEGFAPKAMEPRLAALMAKEDPTRHYHGQSRFLNMDSSGPWGYFEDPSYYYIERAKGFNTEMGAFAIPTSSTIKKFIAPEDRWPINDVWAYHDLHHTTQNFKGFMNAVNAYGEPSGLEDFSSKAQFICYDAWRSMLEAWNSRMWNSTTGLILWMSHPAWPSMIWQTYTYDYETPGSYFGSKKACEPLHIQMNLPDNKVIIVNTTRNSYKKLTAEFSIYDETGKLLSKRVEKNYQAAPNSITECFIPDMSGTLPDNYIIRLLLKDSSGKTLSINDYIKGFKSSFNGMAEVSHKVKKTAKGLFVELKNTSKVVALGVKLNLTDFQSGEHLLPTLFSDGYFNLLPSETRSIQILERDNIPQGGVITIDYHNIKK